MEVPHLDDLSVAIQSFDEVVRLDHEERRIVQERSSEVFRGAKELLERWGQITTWEREYHIAYRRKSPELMLPSSGRLRSMWIEDWAPPIPKRERDLVDVYGTAFSSNSSERLFEIGAQSVKSWSGDSARPPELSLLLTFLDHMRIAFGSGDLTRNRQRHHGFGWSRRTLPECLPQTEHTYC